MRSTSGRVLHFRPSSLPRQEARAAACRLLETPIETRAAKAAELRLEDSEVLLSLCAVLRERGESAPLVVREEAEFLYRFLEKPRRPIGLFDEREYFLGETALLAGAACRMLFRREDARRWFDRAESSFRHTVNAVGEWSRISYQRLALKAEEREFEDVLELLPSLIENFQDQLMLEDALKCRLLEGVVLLNMDRLPEAAEVFRAVCEEAETTGNDNLLAIASNNLVQIHGLLGEGTPAVAEAEETLKIFRRLNNRVGIAKLQWGLGALLRTQGQYAGAIEAYRTALREFEEIGMRSDVAAARLVLADLLLEIGEEGSARLEVLASLPIIEEEKMVPEGMAAFSLLRESLRQQRINRQALRDLHGYFEALKQ